MKKLDRALLLLIFLAVVGFGVTIMRHLESPGGGHPEKLFPIGSDSEANARAQVMSEIRLDLASLLSSVRSLQIALDGNSKPKLSSSDSMGETNAIEAKKSLDGLYTSIDDMPISAQQLVGKKVQDPDGNIKLFKVGDHSCSALLSNELESPRHKLLAKTTLEGHFQLEAMKREFAIFKEKSGNSDLFDSQYDAIDFGQEQYGYDCSITKTSEGKWSVVNLKGLYGKPEYKLWKTIFDLGQSILHNNLGGSMTIVNMPFE